MASYAIRDVMWKTNRQIPKSVRKEMLGYNDKERLADVTRAKEEQKNKRRARRDAKSSRRTKSTNRPAVDPTPEEVALAS